MSDTTQGRKLTVEDFYREKVRSKLAYRDTSFALASIQITAEEAMRWGEDYAEYYAEQEKKELEGKGAILFAEWIANKQYVMAGMEQDTFWINNYNSPKTTEQLYCEFLKRPPQESKPGRSAEDILEVKFGSKFGLLEYEMWKQDRKDFFEAMIEAMEEYRNIPKKEQSESNDILKTFLKWYSYKQAINAFEDCSVEYIVSEFFKEEKITEKQPEKREPDGYLNGFGEFTTVKPEEAFQNIWFFPPPVREVSNEKI